jgi:hypothetical protein
MAKLSAALQTRFFVTQRVQLVKSLSKFHYAGNEDDYHIKVKKMGYLLLIFLIAFSFQVKSQEAAMTDPAASNVHEVQLQ